ncbi:hypothetical protein ACP4OV_003440 [Aristida adscensionis]
MAGQIVSASTGVMAPLLTKLSALIDGEYKHLKSVKPGIRFLRDELATMNAFLEQLATTEKLPPLVKDSRDKIRELSYDIEDCIDLFMYKLNRGKANASFVHKTASKSKKLWSRHQIANKIQELKARVTEEADRRSRYKLDEYVSNADKVEVDPRLPALYVEKDKLVGIEERSEKIMEWFRKEDESKQQLKVVSIVGFGGLGKTTLANQVYHKIKGEFQCTAFIPVSRNPNVAKGLADMLKEVGDKGDTFDNDERQLINKLRAYLRDKRYLVIVDDLWSTSAWELVKSALPDNNLCSRIITTTRNASVATSCCSGLHDYIYNIQPLNEQDSQKLFFKRLFHSESSCPLHLKLISEAILSKCCGLPLAIITIASMLARRPNTKEQWEQVHCSMSSAFSSEGMNEILLLSYHDLPIHLKNCLLYLSMFPEDHYIDKERLIWRWIAEGFIAEVNGQTLDQTGENYFNDLTNRSLIQPINVKHDGRAEACRVHDMVLDLIVSLSEEQNFITVVKGQEYKCSSNKIRRISIQSNCMGNEMMQDIWEQCSQVRSLLTFDGLGKHAQDVLKFENLRVLDLKGREENLGNEHIKYIGSLFQLKYLRISSRGVTELPDQIGGLQSLQTLDIRNSSKIEKLPPTIGCLRNLVRLLFSENTSLCDEVNDMQALQVLSWVKSYNLVNFMLQLRRLTSLRVLKIKVYGSDKVDDHDLERYQGALESSLSVLGKHKLESLYIYFEDYPARDRLMDLLCSDALCLQKLVSSGYISRLPERIASLSNLTYLIICVMKIEQEDLCVLGGMPTLLYVFLRSEKAPRERLTISSQQFPCLKEFLLWSMGNGGLRMVCERGAMPKLKILDLHFKAKEAESSEMGFEFSFEYLGSLEQLNVEIDCDGATKSRVEAAVAALRNTISIHPRCPSLEIKRFRRYRMVDDKVEIEMTRGERKCCSGQESTVAQCLT